MPCTCLIFVGVLRRHSPLPNFKFNRTWLSFHNYWPVAGRRFSFHVNTTGRTKRKKKCIVSFGLPAHRRLLLIHDVPTCILVLFFRPRFIPSSSSKRCSNMQCYRTGKKKEGKSEQKVFFSTLSAIKLRNGFHYRGIKSKLRVLVRTYINKFTNRTRNY